MLTQAMITQKDWEEVAYYIVLIILMVMFMDWFSGWLRRKLIKGDEKKPKNRESNTAKNAFLFR